MVDYLLPLEARRAGERLLADHASEDPFAAAFKATRMPMIITNPKQDDNPIIFCNKAFNDLTGYSSDELIGRKLQSVAETLCGGSWTPLLTHLVQARRLSAEERQELRALIDDLDEKGQRKKESG